MKIDTRDLNPGAWFDHESGEGRICVRILSADVIRTFDKKYSRNEYKYRRGQRYEITTEKKKALELDGFKNVQQANWNYCIVAWNDLFDVDGQPILCTKEEKIRLMGGSPKFALWVAECLERVAEDNEADKDAEKKTSSLA